MIPENKNGYQITASDRIGQIYPNASIGIMAISLGEIHFEKPQIDSAVLKIVNILKSRFPYPSDIKEKDVIMSYSNYYKKFRKTYHLLPQLESVIFGEKPFSSPFPLLQLIFSTELKNLLLTAVHDLSSIKFPVSIGVATGEEIYQQLNGIESQLKEGDMFINDTEGVISSIIYGPDKRTMLSSESKSILVAVYAPEGIGRDSVKSHLNDIFEMMKLISPSPQLLICKVFP